MAAARTKKASAEDGVASWSRLSLRHRASQPKVLSITQRRGCTAKPFRSCFGLTISTATAVAVPTRSPWYAWSAKQRARNGHGRREARSRAMAPWLSCRVAVVQVGGRHGRQQQAPVGVGEQVALASDDAPGRVVAAPSANADAAGARRLRVHHRAARAGLAPAQLAISHRQRMGKSLEHARLRQPQEPAVHRGPGREVARQMSPCAAGPQQVKDGIHHLAQRPAPGAAGRGGSGQQGGDQRPFGVAQACCVAKGARRDFG